MSDLNFCIKNLSFLRVLLVAIGFLFCLSSCEKDKVETEDLLGVDNYYVRYVISGNGPYGRFSNWTATTPQGQYSNSGTQVRSWTQTYGPVNRGFKCEIRIGNYIGGDPTIEVHVSKNNEPFALKVSRTGGSASYVINY